MNMLAMAVAAAATVLLMPATDFVSDRGAVPAHAGRNAARTDVIVGDGDFNQVQPEHPSDHATEHRNHTLRLQYIESMLRSRDVSDMPADLRAERMRNLDRLRAYWTRAEYPVNYEHPTAWEPVFIDKVGAICAVGYLIEQSAGREMAEKIDSRYHFATIKEIDTPELSQWIARSGLTKAEVVTIQGPSLGPNGPELDRRIARNVRNSLPLQSNVALQNNLQNNVVLQNNVTANNVSPTLIQETTTPVTVESTPIEQGTIAPQPVQVANQPADSTLPAIQ